MSIIAFLYQMEINFDTVYSVNVAEFCRSEKCLFDSNSIQFNSFIYFHLKTHSMHMLKIYWQMHIYIK